MIKHALEALRSVARHHALKIFSSTLIQMKPFMDVANSCDILYVVLIYYKRLHIPMYDNVYYYYIIYYYSLLLLVFEVIVPRRVRKR